MYRSQLTLDLLHPSTQRALRDCHDMHRNLMRAFDDTQSSAPRAEQALLYTLMTVEQKPALYVLSNDLPDWSRVRGIELFRGAPPLCIDSLREKLTKGRTLRFQLFASPTKKAAREGKLSARVFLRSEQERSDWLVRQAEKSGFRVLHAEEKEQRQVSGVRQGAEIHYTGVVFSGVLEITDADAFWKAYCNGIGPGKAYGMGMLMLGRA